MDIKKLREDLRESDSGDIRRRRGITALSIAGMAIMASSSLLQMGIIRRLPEPNIRGFDTNKVSLSDDAYFFGMPDGPLAFASFAANLPVAGFGGEDRAEKVPLVPLIASMKSAADVAAAAWYVYRMPTKERAWCLYCLHTALVELGIFALTLPEALRAIYYLRRLGGERNTPSSSPLVRGRTGLASPS